MEDVLDVYERPYNPKRPMVSMDEASKQLVKETVEPLAIEPGKPRRFDHTYHRNGTCNLFMFFEPLAGHRKVMVTERRTRKDWAHCVKTLIDECYPETEKIVLVMDNLNTHTPASLYETFEPAEAKRLSDKLEIHYTPKNASWLNVSEIELSVLGRQCLSSRIPDKPTMEKETRSWQKKRNHSKAKVNWQFTTKDARTKLRKLYPTI